jgi:hypothetical protein
VTSWRLTIWSGSFLYLCNKIRLPLAHHPANVTKRTEPSPHPHTHFFNVCILFFSLGLSLSKSLLTSGSVTTNPYVILIPPHAYFTLYQSNLPYLRTREMFTEKPRLRSFSFQSEGHTPLLCSPSGTNIRLSAAIPNVLLSTLRARTDHYRFKVTWSPSRLRF